MGSLVAARLSFVSSRMYAHVGGGEGARVAERESGKEWGIRGEVPFPRTIDRLYLSSGGVWVFLKVRRFMICVGMGEHSGGGCEYFSICSNCLLCEICS